MGEVVVFWFAAIALCGAALVALGLVAKRPRLVAAGGCLLLALAGGWIIGPVGFAVGGAVGALLALLWTRGRPAA